MVMYEPNKKGMKKTLWDDLVKTSRENPESMFDGTVEKEVKVTNVFLRIMQFELEDIHDIYNKEEPGRDEFDVFEDIFGLTADEWRQDENHELLSEARSFLVNYFTLPSDEYKQLLNACEDGIDGWTQHNSNDLYFMYYPAVSVLEDAKLNKAQCDLYHRLKEIQPEKDHFDTLLADTFYLYTHRDKNIPLEHYIGFIQSAVFNPKTDNWEADKLLGKLYFHVFSYWLRHLTFQFKENKNSRTPEPLKQLCHFLLQRASMFGGTHESRFLNYEDFRRKWERSLSDSWKWLDKDNSILQLPKLFSGMFRNKVEKIHPDAVKAIQEELQQIEKRNSEILD